jgi:GNAT superfamily N-acetyltransferase
VILSEQSEQLDVHPATPARWSDVAILFEGDGPRGCWCMYWRQSSGDYGRVEPGSRDEMLRVQVDDGPPAPGVIAYLDGVPVGWCGFGPRASMERLVRSRTIPAIDDVPVWSIVCFKVRVGYRRRGVAKALLAGAIVYARDHGAPVVEAYPIDTEGARLDVAFSYVGFTSTFEAAGFERVIQTDAQSARRPRWLMRLDLRVPGLGDGPGRSTVLE